jgi:hypothetical protein
VEFKVRLGKVGEKMKNMNVIYRTLLFTALGTFFFTGLAIFASVQAYQQDQDLWIKLARRLGVEVATGENFGIVFGSHAKNEAGSHIEDKQEFRAPGELFRLKVVNAEVEVMTTEGDKVIVQSSGFTNGTPGSQLLKVHEDAANLTLESPEDLVIEGLKIQVHLPRAYGKKVSIHNVTGNVVLKNLEVQAIDVKMVSGEARLIEAISDNTTIKTVSGEVEIENQKPGNIKILTVSGDVALKLKNVESTEIKLKSTSGEIINPIVSHPGGKYTIDVITASGNIQVSAQ